MELIETSLSRFGELFDSDDNRIVYNTASFNELNRAKAESVKAFLFYERGQLQAGQILGLSNGVWKAPFSAPFSSLSVKAEVDVDDLYKILSKHVGRGLKLVWSPPFYPAVKPPKGFKTVNDYNYHYPLSRFNEYENYLTRSGRYNHHRALKHNFEFFKTEDVGRAYGIISENRKLMGYPLAMSLDEVMKTVKVVNADFFVMTLDGEDVASAMLYEVSPGIMQLIYWGDLPQGRSARTMNRLAWHVFNHYATERDNISIIDIGPASTDGLKNEGLCQFKLSLGCVETLRPTIFI